MTKTLKWATHADLAIKKTPTVSREEYLDHMTFRNNQRPLFTEIFGPIIGLKEEWESQGATPEEVLHATDMFAFHVPFKMMALTAFQRLVSHHTGLHGEALHQFVKQRGFEESLMPNTESGNLYMQAPS